VLGETKKEQTLGDWTFYFQYDRAFGDDEYYRVYYRHKDKGSYIELSCSMMSWPSIKAVIDYMLEQKLIIKEEHKALLDEWASVV
jgi:hypothetical protein